jgi:hypothetical protein
MRRAESGGSWIVQQPTNLQEFASRITSIVDASPLRLAPTNHPHAGILAIAARTCAADHTPPRGAEIARPFNSFAIERSEFAPASRTGARSAAREFAADNKRIAGWCLSYCQKWKMRFCEQRMLSDCFANRWPKREDRALGQKGWSCSIPTALTSTRSRSARAATASPLVTASAFRSPATTFRELTETQIRAARSAWRMPSNGCRQARPSCTTPAAHRAHSAGRIRLTFGSFRQSASTLPLKRVAEPKRKRRWKAGETARH